ncbi:MAG: heme biosynthesis HemY N-terminal domain-containing protein, partial [Pseudomonadota bacterium]|nr:heme biosynthesis HemY N-terminal domain-containing protein [Pseudomonadota bacterium]
MRRQVWLILGGLAAGVALVSLLAFDAGYVLVQFGQYRLETTLVAAAIALFLLLWIVRVSFRFLSAILGLGPGFARWLEKRRGDKASALLRET